MENVRLIPGVKVVLADGNTYVFPPLALASLELLQKELSEWKGDTHLAYRVAQHSLSRNYPDITRDMLRGKLIEDAFGNVKWELVPLLDNSNLRDVMEAVLDVSGAKRKKQEQEEADAGKAMAGPSIGITSIAS